MSDARRSLDNGQVALVFRRTARDTAGELLEIEATYRARSAHPPAHAHPHQEETFDVPPGAMHRVGNQALLFSALAPVAWLLGYRARYSKYDLD